jgi:fimbrial chaperone protein
LRVTNSGQRPVRLSGVSLIRGDQEIWNRQGLLGYVLGGSTMAWPMANVANPGPGAVTIKATTRQGSVTGLASVGI